MLTGDKQLIKYLKLDQKGKCLAEYVWIDGHNGLRSKIKVRSKLFFHPLVPNQKGCSDGRLPPPRTATTTLR